MESIVEAAGRHYLGERNEHGRAHGSGCLVGSEEEVVIFEGQWSDGCAHGFGRSFWDGEIREGVFRKGVFVGPGQWKKETVSFVGTFNSATGDLGLLQDDEKGLTICGEFLNGRPHGFAKVFDEEGEIKLGYFRNGEFEREELHGAEEVVTEAVQHCEKVQLDILRKTREEIKKARKFLIFPNEDTSSVSTDDRSYTTVSSFAETPREVLDEMQRSLYAKRDLQRSYLSWENVHQEDTRSKRPMESKLANAKVFAIRDFISSKFKDQLGDGEIPTARGFSPSRRRIIEKEQAEENDDDDEPTLSAKQYALLWKSLNPGREPSMMIEKHDDDDDLVQPVPPSEDPPTPALTEESSEISSTLSSILPPPSYPPPPSDPGSDAAGSFLEQKQRKSRRGAMRNAVRPQRPKQRPPKPPLRPPYPPMRPPFPPSNPNLKPPVRPPIPPHQTQVR